MGATSPKDDASSGPLRILISFDHEGMVRSNGYGDDDNTRSVSTVHGCNTSLDHGLTLLLEQEHRNGCYSRRAAVCSPQTSPRL